MHMTKNTSGSESPLCDVIGYSTHGTSINDMALRKNNGTRCALQMESHLAVIGPAEKIAIVWEGKIGL